MEHRAPLVSVITICKNSEAWVRSTALSVLEQTYPAIEYVIIDGGSTDRTVDEIRSTIAGFPDRNVRWFSEADSGIPNAMNRGILRSNGQIIVHLHAGDRFIDPVSVERVVKSYGDLGWRWAIAGSIVVDSNGNRQHEYSAHPDPRRLWEQNTVPHQSTFLTRDVFERHGYFREDLLQAADYEYWLRLAFIGHETYVVLPFDTTYYLSGGASARLLDLLPYLFRIRKRYRPIVHGSRLTDLRFVSRVAAFWVKQEVAGRLPQGTRRRESSERK